MIKAQLIERIFAQNSHLRRRDAENVINAILDEIIAALARGDRVEIRGFGGVNQLVDDAREAALRRLRRPVENDRCRQIELGLQADMKSFCACISAGW
jgi:integration host factor subunit beta